jgi:hypothetical protein
MRFISPPTVKIGDNTCTSLAVVSLTEMTCRIPPSSTWGEASVSLTYGGRTITAADKFTYRNFTIDSVSPSSGSTTGNNLVTINGEDFPYVSTNEYANDNLVAYYDAIDNTALGNSMHSNDTSIWRDITANLNDCIFDSSHIPIWSTSSFTPDTSGTYATCNITQTLAIKDKITIQVVEKITSTAEDTVLFANNQNAMQIGNANMTFRVGNSALTSSNNSLEANATYTLTSTFDSTKIPNARIYKDDTEIGSTTLTSTLDTTNKQLLLGSATNPIKGTIYAIRIYKDALSNEQIELNASLDKMRYLSTPTITIGNKACTDVTIISSTQITCIAPSNTAGAKDVTIDGIPKANAYTYIEDSTNNFYITTLTPKVAPSFGGTNMTITGNKLDEITSVSIGDDLACTSPILTNNNTTYKCTIPPNDTAGVYNIKVTTTNSGDYNFPTWLEYVLVSKQPISGNVEVSS